MVLEVDNIELNYGTKKILSGIYVNAKKGKVTGILGRNGSGKSSLLNSIFGSLKPKYISVRIDGKNIRKKLFLTKLVAYLPQHRLLPRDMKIKTAFALFEADWKEFVQLFESFKIYEHEHANKLSGGELRLLETYLIVKSNKNILLLDEPFSHIAPVYVQRIKSIIQEEKKQKVIVITDHLYEDILGISDTVYFLKNGCSKQIGTISDLENEGYVSVNSR